MAVSSPDGSAPAAGLTALRAASALLVSLRPAQWVKNLVLPLPFLFGGALRSPQAWIVAAAGFLVFCAVSSSIYLVNDVMDRERDLAHPVKRHRPLASGDLRVSTALAAAAALEVIGHGSAFRMQPGFGRWCAVYAALMGAYSLWLKRIPFIEALIVAAGLPLRALAGAALAEVHASLFLMGCALLLALFLVVGKRQWELQHAGSDLASRHRTVLASYGTEGLDFVFVICALTTVAAYTAYSV
jgi:4-hydroxybenzoate polyprenyltransferase